MNTYELQIYARTDIIIHNGYRYLHSLYVYRTTDCSWKHIVKKLTHTMSMWDKSSDMVI